MTFRNIVYEAAFAGSDDLLKLQMYWNKYRMNLDMGNESQVKKFLKQVKTYYKKVQAKDENSVDTTGKKWSDKIKGVL